MILVALAVSGMLSRKNRRHEVEVLTLLPKQFPIGSLSANGRISYRFCGSYRLAPWHYCRLHVNLTSISIQHSGRQTSLPLQLQHRKQRPGHIANCTVRHCYSHSSVIDRLPT